jgi:hypothetical protein
MKAARQADSSTLKNFILHYARDHATWLSHTLGIGLNKEQRGIQNIGTACLFLPVKYSEDYRTNPKE